jgi:hypothetical protein
MATGHTVRSRENVPVRRSEYEGGTVSYDWEEGGRPIRVSFRANGQIRIHFPKDVVGLVGLRGTTTWTNVDLATVQK